MASPPMDYFASGSLKHHDLSWHPRTESENWAALIRLLNETLTRSVPLAGYLAYEAGFAYEHKWQNLRRPNSGFAWRFFEINCWYEADHQAKTATINYLDDCCGEDLEMLRETIAAATTRQWSSVADSKSTCCNLDVLEQFGELSCRDYTSQVEQILEDIASGRYYELNFTQRFSVNSQVDPTIAFLNLLQEYQPRRAFYARFADAIIGGCSPELYLKKSGTQIFTRPIKGSFSAAMESAAVAEKLHAEHTMVVDLARNDLGRVSDLEWVHVPELSVTSAFGGLKHLESLVVGRTSLSVPSLLSRTYPAASITGAPKVEVVKAIAEYEKSARGFYTGTCGWIMPNGNFDLNVAIRSFLATGNPSSGWSYTLGAGGAIVADSVPKQEYIECLRKVSPLVTALLPP